MVDLLTKLRQRPGWLILIAVRSGGAALAAAAVLGGVLDAAVATTLGYAVALWVVLAASGTALLVLRERRPTRPTTLLTLVAVAGVLLRVVAAGTFATFAVVFPRPRGFGYRWDNGGAGGRGRLWRFGAARARPRGRVGISAPVTRSGMVGPTGVTRWPQICR